MAIDWKEHDRIKRPYKTGGSKSFCNEGLDARFKSLLVESFVVGYEAGEADAIDGATKNARERAEEWYNKEIKPNLTNGI